MAATRAQAISSSMSRYTNDVYLSFRGEDTRRTFVDHLYTALVQAGIHIFRDDEVERGEQIKAVLVKALEESKICLIVFSKNYAHSRWCLEEVVMIMKLKKTIGLIVLPIYYDVDPSEVRNQTGYFSEAFARHEFRFKEEMDMVDRWRAALKEVGELAGEVLGDRHESQFVQDIVKKIENKLKRTVLNVAPYEAEFLNALASSSENGNADVFYGSSMREVTDNTELSLLLFPETENVIDINRRGDGWSQKVYLEWMFVITNFVLELPSVVFDQLSSVQKPQYALISMLFSLISVLVCIVELINIGRKRCTFIDIIGLACAIPQFIVTAINYSFAHRNADSPIKIFVWPIIFAFGLLCSKVLRRPNKRTTHSLKQYE